MLIISLLNQLLKKQILNLLEEFLQMIFAILLDNLLMNLKMKI